MKNTNVKDYFEQRIIQDPTKSYIDALRKKQCFEHSSGRLQKTKLSDEAAYLGLLLLNDIKFGDESEIHSAFWDLESSATRYEKLQSIITENIWDDPKYQLLLECFFDKRTAGLIKYAWKNLISTQYTSSYDGLPFRNPEDATLIFNKRLELLWGAILPAAIVNEKSYELVFLNLSLEEEVIYSSYLHRSRNILIWTAAIDTGLDDFYQIVQDIIHGNHPIGKVNQMIIKALLNSDKAESRMLLGSLLLAAKREEGLRQTILETAGHGSADTFLFLLKLIEEHELFRFSAFTRALDVWLGMGWEAPKETLVKRILHIVIRFLSDKKARSEALSSKDNIEVYLALWCYAFEDVNTVEQILWEYYPGWNEEKRALGILFSRSLELPGFQNKLYNTTVADDSALIIACTMYGLSKILYSGKVDTDSEICNAMFLRFEVLINTFKKDYHFKEICFPWFDISYEKSDLHRIMILLAGKNDVKLDKCMSFFSEMDSGNRSYLAKIVLPGYGIWEEETVRNKLNNRTRQYAMQLIQDAGEDVHTRGKNALLGINLNIEEVKIIEGLLKRKKAKLRKDLIQILSEQEDVLIRDTIDTCLKSKSKEQRLAALDLINMVKAKNILSDEVSYWLKYIHENQGWSVDEKILINQINRNDDDSDEKNVGNGFGLFSSFSNSVKVVLPELDSGGLFRKNLLKNSFGFSCEMNHVVRELARLRDIILQHKDFEYENCVNGGSKEWTLLGHEIMPTQSLILETDRLKIFESYPLYHLWDQWYLQSGLQPVDLFLLSNICYARPHERLEFAEKFMLSYDYDFPTVKDDIRWWEEPVFHVIEALRNKYIFSELSSYLIDSTIHIYQNIPKEILKGKVEVRGENYILNSSGSGWQFNIQLQWFLKCLEYRKLTDEECGKLWQILQWRRENGPEEMKERCKMPLDLACKIYEIGNITKDEFVCNIFNKESINSLTNPYWQKNPKSSAVFDLEFEIPDLVDIADIIVDRLLEIELPRGDSATQATDLAASIKSVKGTNYLMQIVSGLGKTPLLSGMLWSYGDTYTKQQMFSHLLRHSFPVEPDTIEYFTLQVKKYKLSEKQLINVALYSPRWRFLIADYLGWEGLESAIWWMHAHTKTASYSEPDAMLESEVAKYSAMDLQEFKSGGVDIDWFIAAYTTLGKTRWEIVYDSAKYVSEGNGHRRARLYSDALNAKLDKKEVEQKIIQKRDQDYLRVYGLLPLDNENPAADKLHRYELIQAFRKQSKQFGSQKQSSESIAVDVCMSNLARKAGYEDSMRLIWAMESEKVKQIFAGGAKIAEENVSAELVISEDGKADLVYTQDGKYVNKIPAKLKKSKDLEVLIQQRKDLREQYSRSRKTLEEMMISKEMFDAAELSMLESHPVIRPLLKSLVFVSGDSHGFLQNGSLLNPDASAFMLSGRNEIRIAHCSDLYENGSWSSYQKYCFENQIVQPFKQIFRELYIPVEDELKSGNFSRRYEGHQIQPAKTVGLLKSRGWKIDYEQGFQKLFPKEGFSARLYAAADWFSPAEVENPTVSGVEFVDLKNEKPIKLGELNPIVFSEVMRDIDLVVSVAHAGEVDPQASHSTLEMRNVMVRESASLFKLINVEIKKAHAIIQGELGEYTVHLGSGVVHKSPGIYISILAVQSQHRGKIFLPFMDDDPKTAEIISKVLLLAQDNKIKDPTVLEQILKS